MPAAVAVAVFLMPLCWSPVPQLALALAGQAGGAADPCCCHHQKAYVSELWSGPLETAPFALTVLGRGGWVGAAACGVRPTGAWPGAKKLPGESKCDTSALSPWSARPPARKIREKARTK